MARAKKYPPSWIDNEGFSGPAFRFLREIVVIYQEKWELLKILSEKPAMLDDGKISKATKKEIKTWWAENEILRLRKTNQQLEDEIREFRFPKPKPEPQKDKDRFDAFKKKLLKLCKKHSVSMCPDYDGHIVVDHAIYKKGEQPDSYFLINDIRVKSDEED